MAFSGNKDARGRSRGPEHMYSGGNYMIAANDVTLRLGKKALFEDVNIKFTEGNCYGVSGAFGAG